MFSFFYCDDNIAVAAAVSAITATIAIAMVILMNSVFKGNRTMTMIATIACAASAVIATLFCFNLIVLAGYILSVIATAYGLTKWSQIAHEGTIYGNMGFWHRFAKFIIPVSVFFEMSRPFFIDCKKEGEVGFYSFWSALGLRCHKEKGNKWSPKPIIENEGIAPFNVDFDSLSIVSVITLLLFIGVLAMQVILVWRQFVDPDNARDWADAGILVTCIGVMFIYGMFTSNNFKITAFDVENTSAALYVTVALGAINRLLYFEKVENWFDNPSFKINFKKKVKAAN